MYEGHTAGMEEYLDVALVWRVGVGVPAFYRVDLLVFRRSSRAASIFQTFTAPTSGMFLAAHAGIWNDEAPFAKTNDIVMMTT